MPRRRGHGWTRKKKRRRVAAAAAAAAAVAPQQQQPPGPAAPPPVPPAVPAAPARAAPAIAAPAAAPPAPPPAPAPPAVPGVAQQQQQQQPAVAAAAGQQALQNPDWSDELTRIYFNPRQPGSFQSFRKLQQAARQRGNTGLGVRRLKRWLQNQEPYSRNRLFLPRAIQRARVIVGGQYDQFDADLADLQNLSDSNNHYRFLLVVIDVFSRFVWVEALRNKMNNSVKAGFERIFQRGRVPRRLRTDNGKEFTGNIMDDYYTTLNITHFVAMNEVKANYAERAIKTLKSKISRYLTHMQTGRYINVLQDLVHSYNNTKHNTIKMPPAEVNRNNEVPLWWMQYRPTTRRPPPKIPFKMNVGETVRIPKLGNIFSREYDVRWTGEVFIIIERFRRDNINMYKVEDREGEPVFGTFYEGELQRVLPNTGRNDADHQWRVERILNERRGADGTRQALVSFRGWPRFYNRWIPYDEAQTDIDEQRRQQQQQPQQQPQQQR